LDFLVGRLKKQSPLIKYKVLKIFCYLASNGHSEFRSGLRHKADVLREAESFTGQMDYLRGDALNQRVRAAASELIQLLFNVESSGSSTIHAMTGPTGKKMEGFGNSPLRPTKSKTWLDSMKNFAERLPDAANVLKPKNDRDNLPTTGGSGIAFVNYSDSSNTQSDFRTFLDADGSLEASDNEESEESENVLSIEVHLVEEITSEGGIRAVPSKEALTQFTKRCSALNVDKVLEALNDRLLEPVTEVQLKSLHVLEHLLRSDIPSVASRMSHCCTNLQEITRTETGNVLSKATKVLSIIKAKMEKEKIQPDTKKTETSRVTHNQELLKIENQQQFATDNTPMLFSGMSLHSQTERSSGSKMFESPSADQESQHSSEVTDMFQGLGLSSGNHSPKNDNSSRKSSHSAKSDLDELFCVTQETTRPISVTQSQGPIKDSVTDLFDPLCANAAEQHVTQLGMTSTSGLAERYDTKSKSGSKSSQPISNENSLISLQDNSSNVNTASTRFTGFTGSNYEPVNSSSSCHAFSNLDGLSRNRTLQPNVTLPGNAVPMANPYSLNFPNTSHPVVHPSVLSGGSTIPLRLPPPTQKRDFAFVGKSSKADAFSFVQDEMKARK